MKKTTKLFSFLSGVGILLGMASGASADLVINPLSTTRLTQGYETGQVAISAAISSFLGDATHLYFYGPNETPHEQDEFAAFNPSYDVSIDGTNGDATISYTGGAGGPSIGSPAYLLVKDGKVDEGGSIYAWYFFDLTGLGWTGTETILVTNIWGGAERPDAISHVSIYGTTPVPIPGALWLLGSGLAGVLALRRKK